MLRSVATTFVMIIAVFVVVTVTTNGAPFSSPAKLELVKTHSTQTSQVEDAFIATQTAAVD